MSTLLPISSFTESFRILRRDAFVLCYDGGAALPEDIYLIFNGAGILIMQGYGLTETSPVLTSNNPESSRVGSVGRPIRNVQIRIAEGRRDRSEEPGCNAWLLQKARGDTRCDHG
jgi:long-subunit acyl-CoA synthetase (AMP-forming)